ncbi:MAG TPA: TonB-dependent receptor [Chthoniobacterales bacterium]|nr:TonB-dependent receptor [Chthoniobacterales bacterium]
MNRTAKTLLIAISSGGLFVISAIQAQQSTQTQGQPGVTIEEVIVTGSNIPTSEEVGPNPVDVYSRDDLTRLGIRNATDLVQKLPEVMGASITENNVNGGNGRTELNLRGILPKETLVLQDGRRLAPVGFAGDTVDLNTIPIGLIDHVDLLKDGASAIYGADAVAGVFNVYLIHKFRGLEIYSSYGNTNLGFANDQGEERTYLLAGVGDEKTDIVFYAESYNRAAIDARDADISHDADSRSFGGIDARSANFAGHIGGFIYQPKLNGGARSPTPHAFPNVASDPQYAPQNSLPPEQRLFNFSDITGAMGQADREYLASSLESKICDRYLAVFSDFKYMRGFWEGDLAPAPFTPDPFTDATHPGGISSVGISVPIQNPFNPFTVADYTSAGGYDPSIPTTQKSAAPAGTEFVTGVRYRGLEAGVRTDKIQTSNYVFTGGLRGNLGEFGEYLSKWNWESAVRYSEDDRIESFSGIVNTTNLRAALLDPNPATAFNPFGLNQNSRAVINRIFATTNHTGTTSLLLEDLRMYGDLFSLPAAPVAFAIGAEHRTEAARDTPDALTAAGETIGSTNFNPTNGSRDVWSAYWEVLLPITSPVWNVPGLYTLELGYQERYENFSDFGSAERPKFSIRWQPIDSGLTLRGTYTEAYHAPTLSDLFRGPSDFLTAVKDPRVPSVPPNQLEEVLARISGNPKLQPETAYEWTYGAVATPGKWWSALHGLTLSADFYHIDIRGVTLQLDPQFLVDHESQFPGQVVRAPPAPGDPFGPIVLLLLPQQNLGKMIEEGWDYSAVYSFDTKTLGHEDWGTFIAMLRGTYIDRVVVQTVPGGREQNVVGKFGGGFLGTQAGGAFTHNRWFASLLYDGPPGSVLAGLDTGFTVHFAGQYWDNSKFTFDQRDRKVREWTTLDWILSYTFSFRNTATSGDVAGYAKNNGGSTEEKNSPTLKNAEYNPFGWRSWLNNTTVTFGINNLTDQQPPFVAASVENGYDESTANIRGRTWYIALRKRF